MTDEIQMVKNNLPRLEDYVQSEGKHTTELTRSGDELRGAHPVHGSSTDSNFSVNKKTQQWYCHRKGHKVGGDILSWIAVDEGLIDCGDADSISSVFTEVIEIAAEKAGVELGEENIEKAKKKGKERHVVKETLEKATKFFQNNLDKERREWVKEKYGLDDKTIDEARIGYAPPGGNRLGRVPGLDEVSLLKTGLLLDTADGFKDFFQGRIVFPYIKNGDVRYFIGRRTPSTPDNPWEKGKYKKLPVASDDNSVSEVIEEPIYGIDSVKDANTVIVTEGVTDVLACHQNGYAAVAPVTTQFKKRRVRDVAFALDGKKVVVVMDEDQESGAGLQGALKTAKEIDKLSTVGDVSVARLPTDEGDTDIAEFFRTHRSSEFRGVLAESKSVYEAEFDWGDHDAVDLFAACLRELGADPNTIFYSEEDGDVIRRSLWDVCSRNWPIGRVRSVHYEEENQIASGKDKTRLYTLVTYRHLCSVGEFFKTPDGMLYYFHSDDKDVYKVGSGEGSDIGNLFSYIADEEMWMSLNAWHSDILQSVKRKAFANAPEKQMHTIGHYDEDAGELYLNRYDNTYYVLDGETIDVRDNGDDVFFSWDRGEPYTYLEPDERASVPERVTGELGPKSGEGDRVMRYFMNRVNYSEDGALGPFDQRKQFYIQFHAIPFMSYLKSHPIMAFVGEKGSGKSTTMKMVGKFFYDKDWMPMPMRDDEDDFYTSASNEPLTFIDNYDDGVDWANQALAAIATGSQISKRQLFTTNERSSFKVDTWLALTSRTPPFRQDDVADRTLVFRVERFDEFRGENTFMKELETYRDEIWSDYMDNLNDIVRVLNTENMDNFVTSHRMADWAVMAKVMGDALDIDGVDTMLDDMQLERATFALEEDELGNLIQEWLYQYGDEARGQWYTASELLSVLQEVSKEFDMSMGGYHRPQDIGKRLVTLQGEMGELFGLEIDDEGRQNKYKFGHTTQQTGLNKF